MAFTRFLIYRKKGVGSWEKQSGHCFMELSQVMEEREEAAGMGVRGYCVSFHQGCGKHEYGMVRGLGRVADRSSWSKPCSRVGSIGHWRVGQEEL